MADGGYQQRRVRVRVARALVSQRCACLTRCLGFARRSRGQSAQVPDINGSVLTANSD